MSGIKPYRVKARIQNNRLWASIKEIWPEVLTQADAAQRLNMHQAHFGVILNMKSFPGHLDNGNHVWKYNPIAYTIADFLGESVEYLFDPRYYRVGTIPSRIELEVGLKELNDRGELLLESPEELFKETDAVRFAMTTLGPRKEQILRMRHGIYDGREWALGEIGLTFSLEGETIRQILLKAYLQLIHPARRIPRELLETPLNEIYRGLTKVERAAVDGFIRFGKLPRKHLPEYSTTVKTVEQVSFYLLAELRSNEH